MTNLFLKELRINRGMSANELARKIGYSRGYISLVESGRMNPTTELLSKYVAYFGLRSDDEKLPDELKTLAKQYENPVQPDNTLGEDRVLGDGLPEDLTKKTVNLNIKVPGDVKIYYSDVVSLSTSDFGLVFDFGQRMGNTNEVSIVSRIGVSREHAKALSKLLINKLDEKK